jgi:hypothetical protein
MGITSYPRDNATHLSYTPLERETPSNLELRLTEHSLDSGEQGRVCGGARGSRLRHLSSREAMRDTLLGNASFFIALFEKVTTYIIPDQFY